MKKKSNKIKKAHFKDIIREIGRTWTRFVSIVLMTALGVFVLVGLKVTGPKMRDNIRTHTEKQNMYDIYVSSPIGLDKNDMEILEDFEGMRDFETGYYTDVSNDKLKLDFRIISLPDKISVPEVKEGRLPEKSGEIAVELTPSTDKIALGDTISFEHESTKFKKDKEKLDLKQYQYTVVGKVISTDYLVQGAKGSSNISAGTLDTIAYIPRSDFLNEEYSFVKYVLANKKNLNPDGKKYKTLTSNKKLEIKKALDPRVKVKFEELKNENFKKIRDAEKDIEEGRKKLQDAEDELAAADKKIKNAKIELNQNEDLLNRKEREGKEEIAKAKKKLADGKKELERGKKEYEDGLAEYKENEELYLSSKNKLEKEKRKLDEASEQIETGLKRVKDGILEAEASIIQIENGISELESTIKSMAQAGMDHSELDVKLAGLQSALGTAQAGVAEANSSKKNLLSKREEISKGYDKIQQEEKKLEEGRAKLDDAKKKIEDASEEIKEHENTIAEATMEIDNGETKMRTDIADARRKINEAKQKLADGETDYKENYKKFTDKKAEVNETLDKGEADIKDAKDVIDKLKAPKFSVQTREDNESLFFMYDSSHKLDVVSWIFPVFFFFVAMLVAVTTMTRMVEEKRIEIGTYKALGYSTSSIMMKYILYGLLSSLIGGIIGATVGSFLLPKIIYKAYAASFVIKDIQGMSDPITNIAAILFGLSLNVLAVILVIISTLKENAANLLRPKTPKKTKKILIERFSFIWNKLKFLNKVTLRNVFRYKSRMFMTIFGIAGCTGLLFLGFALKESLMGVKEFQFEEIQKYDLVFMVDDALGKEGKEKYKKLLAGDDVKEYMKADTELFTYQIEGGREQSVVLIVPENLAEVDNFMHLSKRKKLNKTEDIKIDKTVASLKLYELTEKNGNIFENSDLDRFEIDISDYFNNYMGHYLIMPKDIYESKFEEKIELNSYYVTLNDGVDRDKIIKELKENESILNVSDSSTQEKTIDDWTGSINAIVLIIIICSTLLAMVVLYNLSNINISERMRELSTIKVLGFSNKELAHYAYRETYILTFIGILIGYVFGWLLFIAVVEVLPPENLMLSTQISYLPYLLSGAISIFFTFIVGIIVRKKLKDIDMVSSLKAYE